jgi:DNA-binding transcriptional MerR regulator
MSEMLSERRTYSISECAVTLGVSVGWLRIGERLGALPLARRTPSGHRFYTPEDIERLRRLGVGQRKKELEERARGHA